MFNLSLNIMIRIAITFKSVDDWGKLNFEQQQLTRAQH
ncbi:MAG: hypothetical protein ACI936_003829 [Paraglaciecola sp.]|jgi:hypothetical protein